MDQQVSKKKKLTQPFILEGSSGGGLFLFTHEKVPDGSEVEIHQSPLSGNFRLQGPYPGGLRFGNHLFYRLESIR